MPDILRTPDARFDALPDYDFAPHYTQICDQDLGDMRLHYVDEGPADAPIVIMMHGEPSWSYLYRFMIKSVAAAGYRVLAPDLIGFGRSDKPAAQSDYTYAKHVDWMTQWLFAVCPRPAVLFCQDWGGLIGLRMAAENPSYFAGIIAANTGLPIGKGNMPDAFVKWREFSKVIPEFPTGMILQGATERVLSAAEIAAYDAPYPDESYKACARVFPSLVPTDPGMDGVEDNLRAWEVFKTWDKPFLTCFSDKDPVTGGGEAVFKKLIPGAKGQPHTIVKGGGHFLQEDVSDALSDIITGFMKRL